MLADLTILANVTNLAKFRQIAKWMQISKHMEASYVGGFDDFRECDEFSEISSNCQMNANFTRRPTVLAD